MIGTFWNLCRACPSMPVDKLHSEYRSTYRWHEYTGPRQEVVRKPPQPVSGNKEEEEVNKKIENTAPPTSGGGVEPALPRRKKNPSLAYRSHDLIKGDSDLHSSSLDRARCLERERERSRRSKSEGPPISPPLERRLLRSDSDPSQLAQDLISNFPVENSQTSGLKNAISRISTEYRLQFGWPKANKWKDEEGAGLPRKSLSMGAIKATPPLVPVHRKRHAQPDNIGGTAELEPLVSSQDNTDFMGEEKILQESFSKGEKLQISGNAEFKTEYKKRFRPFSQYDYIEGKFKVRREPEPQILKELENESGDSWFSEVIELRKKAGEYKHRGWGTELVPEHIAELYNKQITLWEQVSRRSSLSALSLASSTHRSITKEEKEKENNKKSTPEWPDQLIKSNLKNEKLNEIKKDYPRRSRIDQFVRHHLERTTGVGEEGILHSPTREKLEPVVPRRKDNLNEITKSPQKTQSLTGRSQSAGPNPATAEKSSPKRISRASHIKSASVEKKQRPTTLDTAPSRTKPNSGSSKGVQLKTKIGGYKTNQVKQSLSPLAGLNQSKNNVSPMASQFKSRVSPMASQSKGGVIPMASQSKNKEKSAEEVDASEAEILTEPVVKSPPEPTRVKSPEQVLMRSPEPVNWTVPLDTGKTFTVTQNVSESETLCRAQSETKGRCDPNLEPSQSAPPTLEEVPQQEKNKDEELKSGYEAPVAGTTSGCLEEPSFTFDPNSTKEMTPAEVLEIANARFERFWRKQTNQEKPAQL